MAFYWSAAPCRDGHRIKGDKDPSDWLPLDETYQCEYLRTWVALKKHWSLSMDPEEEAFIGASDCFNETETKPKQEEK